MNSRSLGSMQLFLLLILVSDPVDAAIGVTAGQPGVSSSGEAQYSIRIAAPGGVNGLVPQLAISYGHQAGESLAGVGWGISGLSQIIRCAKSVAQNGSANGVKLEIADRYCLDGNQLRHVGGTYGVNGSTYRTEVDLISRVTANGTAGDGPAWFKVEAKDGLIYEYGNSGDSRIESLALGDTSTARVWALNKISDRAGNEVRFTYGEDGAPFGSYRIEYIEYRINPSASISTPGYKIDFVYETQPANDVDTQYGAGGLIEDIKRIDRIDVHYTVPNPDTLIRRYEFTYEPSLSSTNRSRVQSIQECAGSPADCFPATTFAYANGTSGVGSEVLSGSTVPSGVSPLSLDMNGDGRSDVVYASAASGGKWVYRLANSTGGYASAVTTTINSTGLDSAIVTDHDSDGIDDILVNYSGTTWWAIHGSPTSGLLAPVNTATTAETLNSDSLSLDMNGDGRDDLVYRAMFQGVKVRYRATTGNGYSSTPVTILNFNAKPKKLERFRKNHSKPFDANGDGYEDTVVFGGAARAGRWFYVVTGGTTPTIFHSSPVYGAKAVAIPVDFNGDGYSDVAYQVPGQDIHYRLSTGTALGSAVIAAGTSSLDLELAVPIDWNSDGFEDFVAPNTSTNTWYLLKSQGLSFTVSNTGIATSSPLDTFAADSDGDGLGDIAYTKSNGSFGHRAHSGVMPDLLSNITDGNGNTVLFEYASLTDSSVYTRYSNAVFPQQDFQEATSVVSKITQSDGTGSTYDMNYEYEGAQLNLEGRGLSGFDQRVSTDSRDGNSYTEYYHRDFPYRGRLYQVDVNIGNVGNTLVQQTTNNWQQKIGGSGYETYHFPYTSRTIEKYYEGEGAKNGVQINEVTTDFIVDSYGTPYDVTIENVEKSLANGALPGASYTNRTLLSSISNSTAFWCIGKAAQIQKINSHNQTYGTQITRTTSLNWDTGTKCRINSSTVEPSTGYSVTSNLYYDNFGNISSTIVSPNGMSSRTESTNWGTYGQFPASKTNALGQTTTYLWNAVIGEVSTETDPNGIVSSMTYDSFGRVETVTNANLTQMSHARSSCDLANNYCATGYSKVTSKRRTAIKQASGTEIRYDEFYFDSVERVIQVGNQSLSGSLSYQRTVYDNFGRPAQQSSAEYSATPSYFTTVQFDKLGRPKEYSRPADDLVGAPTQTTSVYYEGLTTRIIYAESNEEKRVFDAARRVYRSIDDAGYYQQFDYDAFGSTRRIKDSGGLTLSETTYDYGVREFRRTLNDMNLGSWTYSPNALGEEVGYSDAKLQNFSATFDKLGRPLTRVETEGTTSWIWGTSSASKNIGRLASVAAPGHSQSYTYDTYGRFSQHSTTSDSTYLINYTYDSSTGLLSSVEYPTSTGSFRLKVLREYQYGILNKVKRSDGAQQVYWQATADDAFGNAIDVTLGNGVETAKVFDGVSGLLQSVESGVSGGSALQDVVYSWDKVGNLTARTDINRSLDEDFFYDGRYRLDYSNLNGTQNLNLSYDDKGNVLVKDDVSSSTWAYHSTKKNAVITAGSNTYSYDANGNMTARNGDTVTWSSYNYPIEIKDGLKTYSYSYDANRQKWKYDYDTGSSSESTYYAGGIFEKNVHSGDTEYRHFIYARDQAVAIHIGRNIGSDYDRYVLRDHQGSVAAILDGSGGVDVNQNFNAFGERRDPNDWIGAPSTADLAKIGDVADRGYTDHNHIQDSSLIHMNGRVMDARIGRFLSPDPVVSSPGNTQGWNRYSYVRNNPMTMTDPTGFCEVVCTRVISSIFGAAINKIFGRSSAPPPPNYCFVAGPIGCTGGAPSNPSIIVTDIFSNPGVVFDFGGGLETNPLVMFLNDADDDIYYGTDNYNIWGVPSARKYDGITPFLFRHYIRYTRRSALSELNHARETGIGIWRGGAGGFINNGRKYRWGGPHLGVPATTQPVHIGNENLNTTFVEKELGGKRISIAGVSVLPPSASVDSASELSGNDIQIFASASWEVGAPVFVFTSILRSNGRFMQQYTVMGFKISSTSATEFTCVNIETFEKC